MKAADRLAGRAWMMKLDYCPNRPLREQISDHWNGRIDSQDKLKTKILLCVHNKEELRQIVHCSA